MSLFRIPPVNSPLTLAAVLSGLRAAWLNDGRSARRKLEQMLSLAYSPRELYLTDSGTSALALGLRVVADVTRAPVALPAYCCYDIATAADGAGIDFHLYDVDPSTLSPDLRSLRQAFEAGARSVVVAHLYGVPANLGAVQALADGYQALLIEDAAQGSGCVWHGKPAGSHGALGILSFGRGKGVTGGRGGALLVNDEVLLHAASAAWDSTTGPRTPRGSLKELVALCAQWMFGRSSLYWIPSVLPFLGLGETRYHRPHTIGGLPAFAAGVLIHTLPLASAEIVHRRANAGRLQSVVRDVSHFGVPAGWKAGWLRLPIVLQGTADGLLGSNNMKLGVRSGYPLSLSDLPEFGVRRLNRDAEFPGACLLAARLVTLPTHSQVRSANIPVF